MSFKVLCLVIILYDIELDKLQIANSEVWYPSIPTAPLAVPHCAIRDVKIGRYLIPKGAAIFPHLQSAHLDPKVWEDPMQFNPDR